MEQYLWLIDQIFAAVGSDDPLHKRFGKLNFRLGRQIASYAKQDPPPNQVRTIPVSVLQYLDKSKNHRDISNTAWISFFLLLCPGDYNKGVPTQLITPYV